MKQELINTTIDLYTISRKIRRHNDDFRHNYPEIHAELQLQAVEAPQSIFQLILKELSFFKNHSK